MLLTDCEHEEQVHALVRGGLKRLDLDFCSIGSDGAEIVANFLEHDDVVREVRISSCQIGPRGAQYIAEALKKNKNVVLLDLSDNNLRNRGGETIMNVLRHHNVLVIDLYLSGNYVTGELEDSVLFLTRTRNLVMVPAAARRATLCFIAARRSIADAGDLAVFPKEIVKMIAVEVWATRKDPKWIEAVARCEENCTERNDQHEDE